MRAAGDAWSRSVLLALGLVVAGFAAVGVAWAGADGAPSVPEQVAFAVSGGLGGLSLVGTGLALLEVQRRRYAAAEARRDLAALVEDAARLADAIAARRLRPAPRRRVLRAR